MRPTSPAPSVTVCPTTTPSFVPTSSVTVQSKPSPGPSATTRAGRIHARRTWPPAAAGPARCWSSRRRALQRVGRAARRSRGAGSRALLGSSRRSARRLRFRAPVRPRLRPPVEGAESAAHAAVRRAQAGTGKIKDEEGQRENAQHCGGDPLPLGQPPHGRGSAAVAVDDDLLQLVEVLDDCGGAEDHGVEWTVGDEHGHTDLVLQPGVESAQQRAATGQYDAARDEVTGQFGGQRSRSRGPPPRCVRSGRPSPCAVRRPTR